MTAGLRILWLKTGPLHPLDTGGKIRTYHMLRELKRAHRITFLALRPQNIAPNTGTAAAEYSQEQIWVPWVETPKHTPRFYFALARNLVASGLPYVLDNYQSARMAAVIAEHDHGRKHDLIVCDFLTPSVNLFRGGRCARTPTLLFQHNVESLIWQRTAENARGLPRAYFRGQWRRMLNFERSISARFHGVIGVSEEDCRIFRDEYGLGNVLGAVPAGVDLSYFSPPPTPRKPHSLLFLGSMDWRPNIDGACYFVSEVLPLIQRRFPAVTITIVGRNPAPPVRWLTACGPGIHVTGTVEDVRPYLARAVVMVVPLRIGGGTRIKIYEAMATGIPIVSTTIGAEGLPVTHRQNILLADSPGEFADCVCELLDKPDLRAAISGNGLAWVRRSGSWSAASQRFEQYCWKVYNEAKEPN